ncbi:hypothetical protein ACFVH4_09060 [Nocardia ignorata]|uniref:hypothetical protein n=1 Tax=Nocardia ignorata TaxID=145285 RepID=UPI00363E270D
MKPSAPMQHYSNITDPTAALVRHGPDTVVGLAFGPTCVSLVYLTVHPNSLTGQSDSLPVEVACDLIDHHGDPWQARRLLARRIDACWRHARALAAYAPVPELRAYGKSQALCDLAGLWEFRAGFGSEIMTMIDLACDTVDVGSSLLDAVIEHGFAPGTSPARLAQRSVLVEAIAAAAEGAHHLDLLDPTDLDIATLLARIEPPAPPPTHLVPRRAQPRRRELTTP